MAWFVAWCSVIIVSNVHWTTCAINPTFPIADFLNYMNRHKCTTKGVIDELIFSERYLCTSNTAKKIWCSCDKNRCFASRSCCVDIFWEDFSKSLSNITLEKYIDRFLEKHIRMYYLKPELSCQPVIPEHALPPNITLGEIQWYEMVATCPRNITMYPQDIPEVPVQGSNGFLYSSAYFASCNNIQQYKPVPLELKTSRNASEIDISHILADVYLLKIRGMERFRCHKKPKCADKTYREFRKYFKVEFYNFGYRFPDWGTLIVFHTSDLQIYIPQPRTRQAYHCPNTGQQFDIFKSACVNSTCIKPYKTENSTCVLRTASQNHQSTDSYSWQRDFRLANYYFSVIGTPMSICGYTWAVLSFIYFKELQNLPRLNSICMTVALLLTDTFVFVALATRDDANDLFCNIHAVVVHWSSLCAMVWAFLTALDLSLTFYANIIIPSKINKKRFFIYFSVAVLFPTVLVVLTISFDKHGVLKAGYGDSGICWLTRFESRLYFYIIPIGVGYLVTISALIYIIVSLSRKIASSRSVMKSSLTHGHKTTKFIVNLSLVLGVTEVLGFVQISRPGGNYNRDELLTNAIFSLIYVILRSLRGVFIAFIYIFNKSTLRVLKMSFRKRFPGLLMAWNNKNVKQSRTESLSVASANTAYLSSTHI